MRRMHRERGTAFLVVTHAPRLADRCDRVIEGWRHTASLEQRV